MYARMSTESDGSVEAAAPGLEPCGCSGCWAADHGACDGLSNPPMLVAAD